MTYYTPATARKLLSLIPSLITVDDESSSSSSSSSSAAGVIDPRLLAVLAKNGGDKTHEIFGTGFGGGGSQCKTHWDSTHSMLIVLRGVKRVRLAKSGVVQAGSDVVGGSQRSNCDEESVSGGAGGVGSASSAMDAVSFAHEDYDLFHGSALNVLLPPNASSKASSKASSSSGSADGCATSSSSTTTASTLVAPSTGSSSSSGSCRCVCGGRAVELELQAGDALLIPKNVWHAVQSTPGTLALSIQLAGLST